MKIELLASDLLVRFFQELTSHDIDYCVLRNYDGLPLKNKSKDVDILFRENEVSMVNGMLSVIAKELGYKLIWKNELDYLVGVVFSKIDGDSIYSVKIDLFNGFLWRGCRYIDESLIFNSTNNYNAIRIPNKGHQAFIMMIYYLLYAKKIPTKYYDELTSNFQNSSIEFTEILKLSFKNDIADKILDLVNDSNFEACNKLRKELVLNVLKKNVCNGIVRRFIHHVKIEFLERRKFGVMIVFSGPDGAGKSTLISGIMQLFYSLGIVNSKIPHHFLSEKIPSLHKLPGAPKKLANQDYTKPYQAKSSGIIGSLIRICYYYFAFFLDKIIVRKEMKNNQVVVYDRYFTDMVVDPARIRIGINKNFVQKVFNTLPQPDYVFLILANPESIMRRKDELSEDKIQELLINYVEYSNKNSNCEIINNNKSLEEGQLAIWNKVFEKLEERYC